MNFSTYITVFNNIYKNFLNLKSDFIGIGFFPDIFISFILSIAIALFLFLLYYQIGKKIRLLFFKNNNYKNLNPFINIALGYICINSGIAVFGALSLLNHFILWSYISVVAAIAFFPLKKSLELKNEIKDFFDVFKKLLKGNKWIALGVLLFVLIAFIRLIPPEIGEDAIGYHTSDSHRFLINETTILPFSYVALPVPHLGEMSYVLSEIMGNKDSARYVHFMFYLGVVFILLLVNPYGALFFVTAPVVIQVSSKANVDFQWIICWLLATLLITQSKFKESKTIILVGLLAGGMFASKLWTIAFFPIFILYMLIVYRKYSLFDKLRKIFLFSFFAFFVDLIWLLRSYFMTGNSLYPFLSSVAGGIGIKETLGFGNVIGFNQLMFHMQNVSVFSPLFFLGILYFLLNWRFSFLLLSKFRLSLFFVFLLIEYIFVKYHFGRYLLGLYSLAVLVVPVSLAYIIKKNYLYKIILAGVFSILFSYYFINALFSLPYGLGWADKNKYLTRILSRDNSSYYNFDHKFEKFISGKDIVATYGIYGYYYANFNYVDVGITFNENNKSFDLLAKKNVTKLFIKGGDISWFCKTLNISNCSSDKAKLLATYSGEIEAYYLYSLVPGVVDGGK
ncbi:MAG: hypothetical protein Q8P26_02125 [Candidatus Levybacteria bacterium]|nr:hypothetical protein [Candidatus Levybacteria bacterium]